MENDSEIFERFGLTGNMSDEQRRRVRHYENQMAQQELASRGLHTTHSDHGMDQRCSEFTRIKVDEILYRSNLLDPRAAHRDCELGQVQSGLDLCCDFIRLAGRDPPSRGEPMNVVTRAMTTSDFPNLLANLASKSATLGYTSAPEIWPLIVRQTTTKNFTEFSRVNAPELPAPPPVGEFGQLSHMQLGNDAAEKAAVQSYAAILKISRQSIINDDLAAVALTFYQAGRSAARAIGDAVFAILTGNPTMADGLPVWHAAHFNLGTAGVPSASTMDEVFSLMSSQTGPSGEVLNIRPKYLLASPGRESSLAILRAAMNSADPTDPSTGRITTLTDGRLSGNAWFALADPRVCDGIQVVSPEGSGPFRFEQKPGPLQSDFMAFLVGADFVALPVDYRTLVMNAGA